MLISLPLVSGSFELTPIRNLHLALRPHPKGLAVVLAMKNS
jgi:hypothetical protein